MHTMASVWGMVIRGDAPALESLRAKLNSSIKNATDYFISMADQEYVLRTSRWDTSKDNIEAQDRANGDLRLIAGCLAILEGKGGLEIVSAIRFNEDGTTISSVSIIQTLPRRAKPEVRPMTFKTLIHACRSDHLRDAVREFSTGGDWYSLFKCYEGLKRHYGSEDRLFRKYPAQKADLIRLRRTANTYRHTGSSFQLNANPIGINAAKGLLEKVFALIADEEQFVPSSFPQGQAMVLDYSGIPIITVAAAATPPA